MRARAPIALVGLRAVGKSTLGELLARGLGVGFVDLDECVRFALQTDCCAHHAPSLGAWIREHGWEAFRAREAAELERVLSDGEPRVIATGGGVVERESNRRLLRSAARVVWLRESPEVLLQRIARDPTDRPALTDLGPAEELAAVERRRAPWYAEVAELQLECGGRAPSELAAVLRAQLEASPTSQRADP